MNCWRGIKAMRTYKCKVRVIRDWEVVVYAKNKDEAKKEAPSLCTSGWGITVASQTEILDIEHIPKEK